MSNRAPRLRFALALTLAALTTVPAVGLAAAPALAQTGATPDQVIALAMKAAGRLSFTATRSQQVIRQDQVYHASAHVNFKDPADYQIAIDHPDNIQGLNLMLNQNKLTAYFPHETLLFQSDSSAGAEEARDLIMGKLTDDPAALTRNYTISLAPDMDVVALYPCYKLTLEPKRGFGPTNPPGRRVWIAKDTGLVMKEERYWTHNTAAYFISQYDSFSTSQQPVVKLDLPSQVNKLKLQSGTPTSMTHYASVAAAQADGKPVALPTVLPPGFGLKTIDVMSLYGTDIVLERFSDGLNSMTVTYRAKPNAFLALMAGAFALSLVDKLSALSYQAPNNYAMLEKGNNLVYAYGDLWVDELKQVANSVPIPTTKQGFAPTARLASK